MTEPTTVNVNLIVPNTGDLVGSWGTTAVNPNMVAIDGMLGGFASIGLSSATTLLLTNPGTPSPGAGPNQSQNACIYLTGTLTGNCVLQLTTPREYMFHNQCSGTNTYFVQVQPSAGTGSGNAVGLPPGKKCKIYFDGTNVDFVNPADPGTAYDLHGATAYPPWMTACSVAPYLLKDGSVYNISNYTALGAMLGSTFGGNGITTFGVPDERARARVGLDTNTNGGVTNRLTAALSLVTGTTMGSVGGTQEMQAHNHAQEGTFSTNQSDIAVWDGASSEGGVSGIAVPEAAGMSFGVATVTLSGSTGTTGAGASGNVQPTIVSFLPLIKT